MREDNHERNSESSSEIREKKESLSLEELDSHFADKEHTRLKENIEYEANNYKYTTDGQGRIRSCQGRLRLEKETTIDQKAQLAAGGEDRHTGYKEVDGEMVYDKHDKDDGGHLIGRRFGGSKELDNIVAQNSHLNRSEYKKMENHWESVLNEKDENGEEKYDVDVRIRCVYEGESERPEYIVVHSTVKDKDGEVVERRAYRFKNEDSRYS